MWILNVQQGPGVRGQVVTDENFQRWGLVTCLQVTGSMHLKQVMNPGPSVFLLPGCKKFYFASHSLPLPSLPIPEA
jgi:hypothetical protein